MVMPRSFRVMSYRLCGVVEGEKLLKIKKIIEHNRPNKFKNKKLKNQ